MCLHVGWWEVSEKQQWHLPYFHLHLPAVWKESSTKQQWQVLGILPVPIHCVREEPNTGSMAPANSSIIGKAAPSALVLKSDNSFSPLVSLVVFELLFLHWNLEQVFVSEWACVQALYGDACLYSCPPAHLDEFPAAFHSQMLWGLLFPAMVFWAKEPSMGLGPINSYWRPLRPRYFSQFFTTTVGVIPAILHLHPFHQSWHVFFLISLVTGLLCSWSLGGSQGWLFCNLVVILMWSWREASIIFTYTILTGSLGWL